MPGLVLAWATGLGIVQYRSWKKDGRLAVPGQLLAASGVFVLLGFLAQVPRAQFLASALAWGFDVAALMNVLPELATGGTSGKPGAGTGSEGVFPAPPPPPGLG